MNLKYLNHRHIKLDKVESTNSYLLGLNKYDKQIEGTIVSAANQTGGRGQRGSSWQVESGENLTFSVVLYPCCDAKYAFYLNIIAALAVQKTLSDLKIDAKIKWPNDILVHDKKLCGILVENQLNGSKIGQSVIGIGLNVKQTEFGNGFKATSVFNEGVNVDSKDVLKQVYDYLDFYYNLLKQSNFKLLLKLYYGQMFWFDQLGEFIKNEESFKGYVLGVSELGLLKLKHESGEIKTYDIKEVKFVY